jgi:hypothetical protein
VGSGKGIGAWRATAAATLQFLSPNDASHDV